MESQAPHPLSIARKEEMPPRMHTFHTIKFSDIRYHKSMKSDEYFNSSIQFSASMANKVAGIEESGILKKGMIDTLKSSIGEADYLILGNAIHEILEFHGDLEATNIVKIEAMPTKQEMQVLTATDNPNDFTAFVEKYIEVYNNAKTRDAHDTLKAYQECEKVVAKMMDDYSDFLSARFDGKIPCTQTYIDIAMKAWENLKANKDLYDWYFPNEGVTSELPLWMNPDALEKDLENVLDWDKEEMEEVGRIPQEGITDWMEFPEMKFTFKVQLLVHEFDLNRFEDTRAIHKEIEEGFKPFAMFDGKGMMDKVCIKIDYSNKVIYYRLGDYKSTSAYLNDFIDKYKNVRDYWRQIGMYNRVLNDFFMQYLDMEEWDIQPDVRILAIQTNEWANLKDIKIGMGDLINSQRGGFINPITSFDKRGVYTDIFMQQNNPFFGYKELYKKGLEQVVMTYWDNMSNELQDSLRTDENGVYLNCFEEAVEKLEQKNEDIITLNLNDFI